jgi:hypothetical protein
MQDHDLRLRLRQLPKEIEPARDLWPDIAARLGEHRAARPPRRPWLGVLALAACLCVAVGLAWTLKSPATAPAAPANVAATPAAGPADDGLRAQLVRREAEAMTKEYYAALREFEGAPMPGQLQPAIATLDRSADDIRGALKSDPEVFLLEQLRRTYARRLSLTQRAATG